MRLHPHFIRFWKAVALGVIISCALWAALALLARAAFASESYPSGIPGVSHAVFVPLVVVSPAFGGKGLAAVNADPALLAPFGLDWWYCHLEVCNDATPGRIPMLRQDLGLTPAECYPALLVFNEPDGGPYPVTPEDAADAVQAIQSTCPETYLIVGNTTQSGGAWLAAFLAAAPGYAGALGVHCYGYTGADGCIATLTDTLALYPGPWWLTEYNVFYSAPEFGRLTEWAAERFVGYAPYTNREPGTGEPWEFGPQAWLVGADGALMPNGVAYAEWGN